MNQKGVLLTLMIFFIGIIVVALAISSAGQQKEREALLPPATTQYNVSDQFEETYFVLSDFFQNPAISRDRARVLPFKYEADNNRLSLHQLMPINNANLDEFNDFLNLFELFWETKVDQHSYGDINTHFSFERLKNSDWKGAERYPAYDFRIMPQCVIYDINQTDNDYNYKVMVLKKGNLAENQCEFDRQKTLDSQQKPTTTPDSLRNFYVIQKIVVNIYSDRNITSGSLKCQGSGNEFYYSDGAPNECWRKPFDDDRGWPYGEVNYFVGSDRNFSVYAHFNPDPGVSPQKIDFNLNGSSDQNVVFGGNEILRVDLSGSDPSATIWADVNIWFRNPIESFLLENLSLSVESKPFGIRRLSLDENQSGYCGDGNCAAPLENNSNCPKDCTCGNSVCEAWENQITCNDCESGEKHNICSDGTYQDSRCGCSGNGQHAITCDRAWSTQTADSIGNCPQDCFWMCGNGRCDTGETDLQGVPNMYYCPQDCPNDCTDEC